MPAAYILIVVGSTNHKKEGSKQTNKQTKTNKQKQKRNKKNSKPAR